MTIKDDLVEILPTPTGPMRTCIFRPAAEGRYPGIVFYSEIFQITGPIRRTAAFTCRPWLRSRRARGLSRA